MAFEDCIRIINEAVGRELTDDELDLVLDTLQRARRARRTEASLDSLEDELFNAADELVREFELAAAIEKRNLLINTRIRADLDALAAEAFAATGDAAAAVRARTVGSSQRFANARASVDARGNALTGEYLGGLLADLRQSDTLAVFNSRSLDREIARELAELSKPDGRPGLTGVDDALTIARAIDKVKRAALARENRAGAWIRLLPGHIVRQTHELHRVRRAGFANWRDQILPLLDGERTFQGADPEEFLLGAYNGIVTGRHLKTNGGDESDALFAFKGPANLARRVSQHRVLHFRDADAWFDYNERFGHNSLVEAVLHDLERAARNTAMMEQFGTNPKAMFDGWVDRLKTEHRGDVKQFRRVSADALQNQFAEIDGTTRIAVNPTAASIGAGVRALQSMAKLGGATLSATADLAFKAHEISQGGENMLSSWGKALSSFLEGVAPGDRRAVADMIGVGIDGQLGQIAARFSAQDDTPGRMAKLQQSFFKFNLLAPWTDAHKRGLGLMWSRDLAVAKNTGWANLNAELRGLLELYGLDGEAWDIARQAVRVEADGREYLLPGNIAELPDSAFGEVTARQARVRRDEISTAVRSYIVDRAEDAVPTPGARERAILRQGTQPGTVTGEAVRFIMQFKAFPVTVLTRQLGRTMQADTTWQFVRNMLKGQGDLLGLVHLMIATTALGYVAQSSKEIAKGRTPRDPGDGATWTAAFLQGGGAGIYGDFLFGEFNRFGRSLLDTAAGPTFGAVSDLAELWARFRAGEDAAAASVRFLLANTPFVNLFYTRAALDYLFLYQVQEAVNPGYLRRLERRTRRDNSQEFILPPSQAIPRGGGSRPLEGVR